MAVRSAFILSAGLGTRLRPLTLHCAKPMVPVGDRPALAHVLDRVRMARLDVIAVNVHHRPADVAAFARSQGLLVSEESELLGTAGGLARARALLGAGDVLVWNGDILSDLDPRALVAAHEAGPWRATLAVVRRPRGVGNVGISRSGRIVRLRRESVEEEDESGDFVGVHVVGERLRACLPTTGCLVGDVYLPALRSGEDLRAFPIDDLFVDVGSVDAYVRVNRAWLGRRSEGTFLGDGAQVSGAAIDSIVGAHAVVEGTVTRAIVWPGAVVSESANIVDAVVTRSVVVPFPTGSWSDGSASDALAGSIEPRR